jgi:diguanylate cyclase (GGDEF)-like protein
VKAKDNPHPTDQSGLRRSRFDRENDLYKRVLPCILVVIIQFIIAVASLHTLSIVRAYVGGESLWSKGQKNAIYFLSLYTDTGDAAYYNKYLDSLSVPLSDLKARLALEGRNPDFAAVEKDLLKGGIHPDDVDGIIWLFVNFRDAAYFNDAVARWRATDAGLLELSALGNSIHAQLTQGVVSPDRVMALKKQIYEVNERLTPLAVAFSASLGAGSRAIKNILTFVNLVAAAILMALITWHIRNLLLQRYRFENALRSEKERAQITLASIGEAVIRIDTGGRVEYMNRMAERLLGVSASEAEGARLKSLVSLFDRTSREERSAMLDTVANTDGIDGSLRSGLLLRSPAGDTPVSLVATRIAIDDEAQGAVLILHDMSAEQEYIDRLAWQASHDALTGLANRRAFEHRLQTTLEASAQTNGLHALMFLDLDQFKIVNDTCGHAAGDHLLRHISDLLQRDLQPDDLVARLGGDEFGILIQNCDVEHASLVAEGLRQSVRASTFLWEGRTFNISLSIGLACLAPHETTIEDMLRAADTACYAAKERGRDRIEVHGYSDFYRGRSGKRIWN